jgi:hypothetical protein
VNHREKVRDQREYVIWVLLVLILTEIFFVLLWELLDNAPAHSHPPVRIWVHRSLVEQPGTGTPVETARGKPEQHSGAPESYEQLPPGSEPIPGFNVPGGF